MTENEIYLQAIAIKSENESKANGLRDVCLLSDFAKETYQKDGKTVWTRAFQSALDAHETVVVPPAAEPYWLDGTVAVPSHRKIMAQGAVVKQLPGVRTLMFRNRHPEDGRRLPIRTAFSDEDIFFLGGTYSESHDGFARDGSFGRMDEAGETFFGVGAAFYFGNVKRLTLSGVTFQNTGCFAFQCGNIERLVCENITFDRCFADGLHLNGNIHGAYIKNVRGQAGDDLVALNMYDWQGSSVNYGPADGVYIENIEVLSGSLYSAMRILPGRYTFENGEEVDCSLTDTVIRSVRGVSVFKVYLQTPAHPVGDERDPVRLGSVDSLYFDDIDVDLSEPADKLPPYVSSDPRYGHFGAFEFGSACGRVTLSNIRLTLHPQAYPYSHLAVCGPKSAVIKREDGTQIEFFNPALCPTVDTLTLRGVTVNGEVPKTYENLVYTTKFDEGFGQIRRLETDAPASFI